MISKTYQQCTRCVMDTTANGIEFDNLGVCSFCTEFLNRSNDVLNISNKDRNIQLNNFVTKLKQSGKGKKYDCIVGVSGGVDSSWVLVQAVKLGLKPLAVHMDNGWNSELAQNNISNLVNILGVDLYTHVIEWGEYKQLMLSFFEADVIDVELLYDNAMLAVNYELAAKHGIKYMLSGCNQSTEGMNMPSNWNWWKFDKKNIASLGKMFRGINLKTFPALGIFNYIWHQNIRKREWVPFLDYFEFNKNEVLEILAKEYKYKPYPYKHYESIFTRFYQGYILPNKFGVDKRKLHLSTLIATNQMERDKAISLINELPYPSQDELNLDIDYFLKKIGWTTEELAEYISRPEKPHGLYPSDKVSFERLQKLYTYLKFWK